MGRELNISLDRAVEHLANNGHQIEARPTTKITQEEYQVLLDGFETDASKKAASKEFSEEKRKEKEALRLELEAKLEKQKEEEAKKEEILKAKAEKSNSNLWVKSIWILLENLKKRKPKRSRKRRLLLRLRKRKLSLLLKKRKKKRQLLLLRKQNRRVMLSRPSIKNLMVRKF